MESKPIITTKAKLVTIVFPYGTADRLVPELKTLGISGYTTTQVNGFGVDGVRKYGLTDGANIRLETVVTKELAERILEHLVRHYDDVALIAYSHDADAIPPGHFGPTGT